MDFRTRAIHIGQEPDPQTGAVVPPIHLSSTFIQPTADSFGPYEYSRCANPTRDRFLQTITVLEGGVGALGYSSGIAAIHGVFSLLRAGDHIVAGGDIYGGTYRLLTKILPEQGIEVTFVPGTDTAAYRDAITDKTKLFWFETIGNPLLSVPDAQACIDLCKEKGILCATDSTFTTPVLLRPLELGCDIVVHSATKYIGGHSDVLGGVAVVREQELLDTLHTHQFSTGSIMGPLESYLCSRGLKTLQLRVEEQSRTAMAIAEYLSGHSKVTKVYYPGLLDHPGHAIAKAQFGQHFGGVLSFEVQGGASEAKKVAESLSLFALGASLGAVESLVEHAWSSSHAAYSKDDLEKHDIKDTLIRLSIGLESLEDLRADLEQALS